LKLKYDEPLSNFAFNFNWRPYGLGFGAIPIHGQMSQPKRLGALNKFKAGERNILVATDVASRGLDIPSVDVGRAQSTAGSRVGSPAASSTTRALLVSR